MVGSDAWPIQTARAWTRKKSAISRKVPRRLKLRFSFVLCSYKGPTSIDDGETKLNYVKFTEKEPGGYLEIGKSRVVEAFRKEQTEVKFEEQFVSSRKNQHSHRP